MEMCANDLPDAITNPKTPRDHQRRPIADGHWYRIYHGRLKPIRVLVREDLDQGELVCRAKGGERWQLVNQMDPDIRWERVEDDEV